MGGLALRLSAWCLALFLFSSLLLGSAASAGDDAGVGLLSMNGTKFMDIDGDGVRDSDEAPLSGWKILLQRDGVEISNSTTDQQGRYQFNDLAPGNYTVMEVAQAGWNVTFPGAGLYQVTLTDRSAERLDFGNRRSASALYSPQESDHPVMRPTEEEMRRWLSKFNATPKLAPVYSPQIAANISEPPASFSLMEYLKHVPSERNQGSCGNCWAWAGTGVLEVDLAYRRQIEDRLSIQFLTSSYQGGSGKSWACCGGWLSDLADFYTSQKVAVPWSNSNAQWQDGRRSCDLSTSVPASLISTNPRYSLGTVSVEAIPTQQVGKEAAIANIKNALLSGRAVWVACFLPTDSAWRDFKYFWGSEPQSSVWRPDYCGEYFVFGPCPNAGGGHAVLCVGYDETDPNNRSWLMLNSWGSSGLRPEGLFRMSMDIDYGCSYPNVGYAYYWQTLKVSNPTNTAPSRPTQPQGATRCYLNSEYSYTSLAFDPEGDQVRCLFDWGDRTAQNMTEFVDSGSYISARHRWRTAGNYSVRVRAIDSKGLNSEWSEELVVVVTGAAVNMPPVRPAAPSGPTIGSVGTEYRFSSTALDPENDPLTYTFDWGDGSYNVTPEVPSGAQWQASHIWSAPATYPVRVRATDRQGSASGWSDALNVTISTNANPAVPMSPVGPSAGVIDAAMTFNSSASDPDGDFVKITFFWGDGQSAEVGPVPSGSQVQASHIWTSAGTYQVWAQAVDSRGGFSGPSKKKAVKINRNSSPAIPRAPQGPTPVFANSTGGYSVATKDPERDRVRYSIRWGDGNISTTRLVTSGTKVVVYHRWTSAGTYQVQVQATDANGAISDWSAPLSVQVISRIRPYQNGSRQPGNGTIYLLVGNQTDINGTAANQTEANLTEANLSMPGPSTADQEALSNQTRMDAEMIGQPGQVAVNATGGNETSSPAVISAQPDEPPAVKDSDGRKAGQSKPRHVVRYLRVSMGG